MSADSPAGYYRQRLAECQSTIKVEEVRLRLLSHARLFVFLLGVILCLILSPWPIWLSVAAITSLTGFFWLVMRYRDVAGRLETAQALEKFFEHGLARIEDRWPSTEETGHAFLDPHHPFAADLDLFGSGSLFQLLQLGWTPMGDAVLARWLTEPVDRAGVLARQEAVKELTGRKEEREGAIVRSVGLAEHFHPESLTEWAQAATPPWKPWERVLTEGLVVLTAVSLAAWLAGVFPGWGVLAMLALMGGWAIRLSPRVNDVLRGVDRQAEQLSSLARLLSWFEKQTYECALLQGVQSAWITKSSAASSAISELAHLCERLEWPRNVFFLPIGLLLMWRTRIAVQVTEWRIDHGRTVAGWLDAAGQMETIHALATFTYEHPEDVFPEVIEEASTFEAVQLGHPLISAAQCKCNDVRFGIKPQLLLVSGSNMSGKSTLLRTVGISVVLTHLGAPVRAKSLRLSIFYPGATLRVQDSLQTGISRFYAEILRLRQLLDLSATKPLLFLVDEILAGTNSAERRQGASGILQALLDRGAVGLATTHDLALTEIAAGWGERALNVHFADSWQDGRIVFDYQLRPGVVSHGNALALMRAVGLEV